MSTCKVTFENSNKQKVILFLSLDEEKDELSMKIGFQPQVDPKTDLGLAGRFAEYFCKVLNPNFNTDNNDTSV